MNKARSKLKSEKDSMTLLYICPEFPPENFGGIGTFYHEFILSMKQQSDSKIHVVVFGEFLPIEGVIFHNVSRRSGKFSAILQRVDLIREIFRICREFAIDVIELPEYGGYFPVHSSLFENTKVVLRLHSSNLILSRLRTERFFSAINLLEWLTLYFNRNWIAVSKHILDETIKSSRIKPALFRVIENAVNIRGIKKNSQIEYSYFVFLGSLSLLKGVDLAAKAFNLIASKFEHIHMVFVGRHVSNSKFDSSRDIFGWIDQAYHSRVNFLGHISKPEAMGVVESSLALVFPSRFESSGLALYETMLLGKASIIPKIEPFTSSLNGKDLNFFFNPESFVDLASRMEFVVRNQSLANSTGSKAREFVKAQLNETVCVNRSMEFYRQVAFK